MYSKRSKATLSDAVAVFLTKMLNKNNLFKIPFFFAEQFCNYLTTLYLQAKREPLCFQNPSVNNKLLRTPPCVTLNSTSKNGHVQNEEELELVCRPITDFLETRCMNIGKKDCSPTSSNCKLRPIVCI